MENPLPVTTESTQNEIVNQHLEILRFKDVSQGIQDELTEFSRKELEEANKFCKEFGFNHPECNLRQSARVNHVVCGIGVFEKNPTGDGYLLIKRNESNQIAGFGILLLDTSLSDPNRVRSLYFGRAFDQLHQGIGEEMLNEEHAILRSRGIAKYHAYVRPHSKKVFEKIGVKTSVTGVDDGGSSKILVEL
jgi:hypothetical protein